MTKAQFCVYKHVYVCLLCVCKFLFVLKLLIFVCIFASARNSLLQHCRTEHGELEGKDLSKWVTFPTASPVVNLMGSLSPHGHCYDSPVTNYHRKPINTSAMEECQHVKTTEAAESWSM